MTVMTRDDVIDAVKENLIRASYHYADDSTKEWSFAHKYMTEAAQLVVENDLSDNDIQSAFDMAKPLVTFQHLKNKCIVYK